MSAAGAAAGRGERVLRSSVWVPAPVATVWPFFSSAHNLQELTPAWLRFAIVAAPPQLGVDARIDYRLRLHGVPLRWRTRIARWEPERCFVDEQERGPYRRWVHTHTFEPLYGGTMIGDRVAFVVRGGPLAGIVRCWFVEPDLRRIFRYRLTRITQRFGGDPSTGTVALHDAGAAD